MIFVKQNLKQMTTLEFSYSINQFSQALKNFAIKLTRDRDDAQDLLQETMLKAVSNKDKFTSGTNLRAWLYTIMKNTFITNYQKLMRRKTFIDTTDSLHYINSRDSITENLGNSYFILKDIDEAIDKLEAVYKTPFMMYFNGFKYYAPEKIKGYKGRADSLINEYNHFYLPLPIF